MDLSIRLCQRRAAGAEVVEHEGALVHFGEESGADELDGDDSGEDESEGHTHHPPRAMQHAQERLVVSSRKVIHRPARPREDPRSVGAAVRHGVAKRCRAHAGAGGSTDHVVGPPSGLRSDRRDETLGEQRDDGQRESERHEHGNREGDRQCDEELTHHALQQAQREKHDDGGDGRRGDRPDQLLDSISDREMAVRRQGEMARDVLGHYHGIVDDESNGDGHRAERHQIERLADEPHDEHRNGERQRDRRRADGRDGPVA